MGRGKNSDGSSDILYGSATRVHDHIADKSMRKITADERRRERERLVTQQIEQFQGRKDTIEDMKEQLEDDLDEVENAAFEIYKKRPVRYRAALSSSCTARFYRYDTEKQTVVFDIWDTYDNQLEGSFAVDIPELTKKLNGRQRRKKKN